MKISDNPTVNPTSFKPTEVLFQKQSPAGISSVKDTLTGGKGLIHSSIDGIAHMIASVLCKVKDTVCWVLNCCSKNDEVEVSDLAPAREDALSSFVPENVQVAMDVQDRLREGNMTREELLKFFDEYVPAAQQKTIYLDMGTKAHDARGRTERLKSYLSPVQAYQVNLGNYPEVRALEMETKGRFLVQENPIQAKVVATLATSLDSFINEGMQKATQTT